MNQFLWTKNVKLQVTVLPKLPETFTLHDPEDERTYFTKRIDGVSCFTAGTLLNESVAFNSTCKARILWNGLRDPGIGMGNGLSVPSGKMFWIESSWETPEIDSWYQRESRAGILWDATGRNWWSCRRFNCRWVEHNGRWRSKSALLITKTSSRIYEPFPAQDSSRFHRSLPWKGLHGWMVCSDIHTRLYGSRGPQKDQRYLNLFSSKFNNKHNIKYYHWYSAITDVRDDDLFLFLAHSLWSLVKLSEDWKESPSPLD